MRPLFNRSKEISRLRNQLERSGYPRMQMLLLVLLTGGAGFLASYFLLTIGFGAMWSRYLLAISFAYAVFLVLLWLWLRAKASDFGDLPDPGIDMPSNNAAYLQTSHVGNGGGFDGGGASGNYEANVEYSSTVSNSSTTNDVMDAAGAADEFAIPLLLILIVGTVLMSSLWIVYSAPVLFAELLVDGVLAASLYRRLRGLETRFWLDTAIRRTGGPFVLVAVILMSAGWGLQHYAPGAHTLGEALQYYRQSR